MSQDKFEAKAKALAETAYQLSKSGSYKQEMRQLLAEALRESASVKWPILAVEHLNVNDLQDAAYIRGFFDAQKAFEQLNTNIELFNYGVPDDDGRE